MKPTFVRILCLLTLALCTFGVSAKAQNKIQNGSFEDTQIAGQPNGLVTVNVSDNTGWINPWKVIKANPFLDEYRQNVDLVHESNTWTHGSAADGTQYVDLDGSGPGGVSQDFLTEPGVTYTLTFQLANNYVNQSSASVKVDLFDTVNHMYEKWFSHSSSLNGNLDWTLHTVQFEAMSTMTTLQFSSLSPEGNVGGILLDDVGVYASAHAPEPGATGLALVAAGLLGFRRRRKVYR